MVSTPDYSRTRIVHEIIDLLSGVLRMRRGAYGNHGVAMVVSGVVFRPRNFVKRQPGPCGNYKKIESQLGPTFQRQAVPPRIEMLRSSVHELDSMSRQDLVEIQTDILGGSHARGDPLISGSELKRLAIGHYADLIVVAEQLSRVECRRQAADASAHDDHFARSDGT